MSEERPRYSGFVNIYDTVPLDIHGRSSEQTKLTKEIWNPLSDKELIIHRNAASSGNDAISEIMRTFILEEESLDSPLMSMEQLNHRCYILRNIIHDHTVSEDNPMPSYTIHGRTYAFSPASFKWCNIINGSEEITGIRMFLYRNPHVTPGSMYWSYVNRLFAETNTILTLHGQQNIPLHLIQT